MYDPTGHSAILVGIVIGAIFGLASSLISDAKDNGSIDFSIGGWAYAGSIIGGAISGAGSGFISTVLLSAAGSVANSIISSKFNPDMQSLVLDVFASMVFAGIGYGVGQAIRYGAAGLETKVLKKFASKFGNGGINNMFKKMKLNVNIGMKDSNKIANALFNSSKDYVGIVIESSFSNIPDFIRGLF